MKHFLLFGFFTIFSVALSSQVILSEIHYDNAGGDVGEFIEVTGTAGTNLTGYSIVLYNGNGGTSYDTESLNGVIPDNGTGIGAVVFFISGIQNGGPDGFALVDPMGNLVEFLSYEGSFTATNGPAAGVASTDIGVSESNTTPSGQSLQRTDAGWVGPIAATQGTVNAGLTIAALPVELSIFKGQTSAEGNHLTWTTVQEQNNDYFQVQRSTDTQEWTTIGQVAGNGTTEVESNYEFLDREPATGVNYYRLQQFDYDGASEIHRTISVRNGAATGPISVFPNPVQEELTIRSHSAATVVVTDRLGRIVSSVRFDATETPFQMDTREWAIGTYFVSVRTVDGVNTTKIVKQ